MNEASLISTSRGAILIDASRSTQADERWFDPAHWCVDGAQPVFDGGRGSTWFVELPTGACVLRHYRRGGMVANLLGDRYLWRGAERTRAFAEWRLLAHMRGLGLPVPEPIAARYVRHGLYYQADLITRRIEASQTLAQHFALGDVDGDLMQRVGSTVAEFHAAGVFHADLNAHNVMVTSERIHLLDFDRGERRQPSASWRDSNLARLLRSLHKVTAQGSAAADRFDPRLWQGLMRAYQTRLQALQFKPAVSA